MDNHVMVATVKCSKYLTNRNPSVDYLLAASHIQRYDINHFFSKHQVPRTQNPDKNLDLGLS